jgi:hypothetical protein
MIQAANVGVGISGEEGLQAARAADYTIAQFRYPFAKILNSNSLTFTDFYVLYSYSMEDVRTGIPIPQSPNFLRFFQIRCEVDTI